MRCVAHLLSSGEPVGDAALILGVVEVVRVLLALLEALCMVLGVLGVALIVISSLTDNVSLENLSLPGHRCRRSGCCRRWIEKSSWYFLDVIVVLIVCVKSMWTRCESRELNYAFSTSHTNYVSDPHYVRNHFRLLMV